MKISDKLLFLIGHSKHLHFNYFTDVFKWPEVGENKSNTIVYNYEYIIITHR